LTGTLAAETQPATGDVEQTRTSGLNNLDVRAIADSQLGQPANPGWLAGDGMNFAPFSGAEQFQWHEWGQSSLARLAGAIEIQSQLNVTALNRLSSIFPV
jgi:hypothetical protein